MLAAKARDGMARAMDTAASKRMAAWTLPVARDLWIEQAPAQQPGPQRKRRIAEPPLGVSARRFPEELAANAGQAAEALARVVDPELVPWPDPAIAVGEEDRLARVLGEVVAAR